MLKFKTHSFSCLVCLKYLPAASLNLKANIGCVHVRYFNLLERWMALENNRHFATPSLVSTRNDVLEKSAEIP